MNPSDILYITKWWLMFFVIGLIFLPLTTRIFSNFFDKGYIFAKVIGMAFISYVVFVLGILKILPFTELTIFFVVFSFLIPNILISKSFFKTVIPSKTSNLDSRFRGNDAGGSTWKIFFFEEILFVLTLIFWSFIRAHQPDIHGLEKYMDFGFINSILRSDYFPPRDMWLTPYPINYYYFGHLVTAILTKLSGIPSAVTFNLMLSTLFAFTFTGAFSIGANLIYFLIFNSKLKIFNEIKMFKTLKIKNSFKIENLKLKILISGLLSGFLLSFGGSLHTIYSFFKPYANEHPVPFWQLAFSPNSFPNGYWYPNATRFIENTIHEFPIYSSVVSDLHGHFLDVPFVLLTIAILLSVFCRLFSNTNQTHNPASPAGGSKLKTQNYISKLKTFISRSFAICDLRFAILLGFILAIMYMTNAWDGLIYLILTIFVLFYLNLTFMSLKDLQPKMQSAKFKVQNYSLKLKVFSFGFWFYALRFTLYASLVTIGLFLFSLPFSLYFKPFASGIGILCAPEFLTNVSKIGPFLFEKDHCLRSPIWQLFILYGFFYFWAVSFLISILRNARLVQNAKLKIFNFKLQLLTFKFKLLTRSDIFVLILILFSTLLIIIPEFIYVKDIYPGHYRANTMFKLVYQAFIMLSIASGYIIVRIITNIKYQIPNVKSLIGNWKLEIGIYLKFIAIGIGSIGLLLVSIYPYFAINSYYGDLKTYYGLDGISYLKNLYPTDYKAILWINKNIKEQPVILEAQGDSYTDYARVSSNTGLPTVLGWTVHEWLWRGTYDIPSPRIPEVQKMYESEDLEETKRLLNKHNVSLVFLGDLERQKYPKLSEDKFKTLGKVIYQKGKTKIYEIFF